MPQLNKKEEIISYLNKGKLPPSCIQIEYTDLYRICKKYGFLKVEMTEEEFITKIQIIDNSPLRNHLDFSNYQQLKLRELLIEHDILIIQTKNRIIYA